MERPSHDDLRRFNEDIAVDFQRVEAEILRRVATAHNVPQVLYHYTNLTGFRGIVESQTIWATGIRYLNDSRELSYSNEFFKSVISARIGDAKDDSERELLGRFSNTFDFRGMLTLFVAAFSEVDDDLSQWRGYAQGVGGIALGLDLQHLPSGLQVVRIEYDESAQQNAIQAILDNVILLFRELSPRVGERLQNFLIARCCQLLRNTGAELLVRFKSKHWRNEKEWRLVVALDGREKAGLVRFRSGHFGLIPYIELLLHPTAGVFRGRLPITQVVIGPHHDRHLFVMAMTDYLASREYTVHTDVRVSDVPLRF